MKIHKILIRFWESINLVSITFLIILGLACSGTLYNKVFDIQLVKCHDCRWLWSMNVGWVCLKQHFMIFWMYCDWHFDGFFKWSIFLFAQLMQENFKNEDWVILNDLYLVNFLWKWQNLMLLEDRNELICNCLNNSHQNVATHLPKPKKNWFLNLRDILL